MAQDKKYSFITVDTDDDDDMVIQAGVPAAEPQLEVPPTRPTPEPMPASQPPSAASDQLASRPAAKQPEKGKDAYHETTLADLDSAPMGSTQKIIIGAAILAVIAFVVYLFL